MGLFLNVMGYILLVAGVINGVKWVWNFFADPEPEYSYGVNDIFAIIASVSLVSGCVILNRDTFAFLANPMTRGDMIAGCTLTFLLFVLVISTTFAMIYYSHKERKERALNIHDS